MVELQESLRRVGSYRRAEAGLFEVLGGWVAAVPEPEAKILLGRHCHHHAWRAGLWAGHLHGADATAAIALHPFLATLAGAGAGAGTPGPGDGTGAAATVERLAGAYRVAVPRLIGAYHRHLGEADPVADAAVARTLRLALDDATRDWREGEALLQSMIATVDGAAGAARRVGELEGSMIRTGGFPAGEGGASPGELPR